LINIITEKIYRKIWENLKLVLKFERVDFILYYWKEAYDYFRIDLNINERDWSNITKEDEKMDEERSRFMEFHYALGPFNLQELL